MKIEHQIPLLESILNDWREVIGEDYDGYRNHVYRMLHCAFLLHECSDEDRHKLIIAAAFHDIGLWTDKTLDYIPPSLPPAMAYLKSEGLDNWIEEVCLMISEHHKVSRYEDRRFPLVELFRQADLVDFSLGVVRFGIAKSELKALREAFPNAGFHMGLVKKASRWFVRHPLNPAPMMKR